jgi:uncharacterized protein YndB with AHSA1/START domain
MYGDLERSDDQCRLRFSRRLPHPPEKVWRAITEPEHLEAWFPQRIVGEWAVGSPLRFESEHGSFDGEVLRFEPESLIEFRWGTDTIRMEVTSDNAGSILSLVDTFSELGKAARDAAGWHTWLTISSITSPAQKRSGTRARTGRRCTRATSTSSDRRRRRWGRPPSQSGGSRPPGEPIAAEPSADRRAAEVGERALPLPQLKPPIYTRESPPRC